MHSGQNRGTEAFGSPVMSHGQGPIPSPRMVMFSDLEILEQHLPFLVNSNDMICIDQGRVGEGDYSLV
jgi:hypothetical protein